MFAAQQNSTKLIFFQRSLGALCEISQSSDSGALSIKICSFSLYREDAVDEAFFLVTLKVQGLEHRLKELVMGYVS